MGSFRFYRRLKIAPGITLNFSKSGVSTSLGPRGAKVTIGSKGVRKTFGIPGTGMYYTDYSPWGKKNKKETPSYTRKKADAPSKKRIETSPSPKKTSAPFSKPSKTLPSDRKTPTKSHEKDKLSLSFLDRIFMPPSEVHFVDALKAYTSGDNKKALSFLKKDISIADAAFFAGFLSLIQKDFCFAIDAFKSALSNESALGKTFEKIGISIRFNIPITDYVELNIVKPDKRSALFALAESYQGAQCYQEAIDTLIQLYQAFPNDLIVKNSLAEIILEAAPGTPNQDELLSFVERICTGSISRNLEEFLLVYYRGCAQMEQHKFQAALESFSLLIPRDDILPPDLYCDIRYQRGKVFLGLGDHFKAKQDFLWVEKQIPDYKDTRSFFK